LSLGDVLDAFLVAQKMKGLRSLDSIKSLLQNHVRPYFRGYRAVHITTVKLRDYVVYRQEEGAKPASIKLELAHLHGALALAVDDKRLHSVPKFPTIKFNNARQGFVEPGAFERLHAELPDHLKDLGTFLYWSAWRSNEAKTLQWRDVNIEQGEIRLRSENSKNTEGRVLPLFGALREVIERRHAARRLDVPYVFSRDDGRPLDQITRIWQRAALRAGLGPLTPHDCRRSGVRNLVRSGVSQQVAMSWSGHKTAAVFARYNITSGDDLTAAAKRLNSYVSREQRKPRKVIPLTRTSTKLAKSTGTAGQVAENIRETPCTQITLCNL
jgi:integrase